MLKCNSLTNEKEEVNLPVCLIKRELLTNIFLFLVSLLLKIMDS